MVDDDLKKCSSGGDFDNDIKISQLLSKLHGQSSGSLIRLLTSNFHAKPHQNIENVADCIVHAGNDLKTSHLTIIVQQPLPSLR